MILEYGSEMLYLRVEPERCPPHRRGVSDRQSRGQAAGGRAFVVVTRQFVRRGPRSLSVSRWVAGKDFRRRQVIVQDRVIIEGLFSQASATGGRKAIFGFPLQHTQLCR